MPRSDCFLQGHSRTLAQAMVTLESSLRDSGQVGSCLGGCSVDERDLALRSLTYGLFVRLGRAPTASEAAVIRLRAANRTWSDAPRLWLWQALTPSQSGDRQAHEPA